MAKQEDQNEQVGQLAGLGAGALLGAQMGSVIPGPGTVVGAVVGGMLGSQVGRTVGATALSMFGFGDKKPAQQGPSGSDMLMQLERLSQMRTHGILSEEEFAAAKQKLLDL